MRKYTDEEKLKYYKDRTKDPSLTQNQRDHATRRSQEIDEIRYNDKTKHPSWLCERCGNMRKSVGLTHKKWFNGKRNIPLPTNPNPRDPEPSYFNPNEQYQHVREYGKKEYIKDENWKMSPENKKTIRKFFRKKKPPD